MKSTVLWLSACLIVVPGQSMAAMTQAAPASKKPDTVAAKKPAQKDAAQTKPTPAPAKTEPAKTEPAPPPNPAMLPRAGLSGQELIGEIDLRLGYLRIFKCAPRIRQAILALSEDQKAEFIIEPMSINANAATNVVTIESAGPAGGGSRYDVLQVNPGCDGLYTQTIYWNKPCDSVKANDFGNFAEDRMMLKSVRSYRYGSNLQLSLIKADKGCISIKKEMFL